MITMPRTSHELDMQNQLEDYNESRAGDPKNGYLTSVDTQLDILKARIEAESDVRRVMALERSGALYRYMIETTHHFPRFVIGTTDEAFDDVRPIFKCGAEWSARKAWDERNGA